MATLAWSHRATAPRCAATLQQPAGLRASARTHSALGGRPVAVWTRPGQDRDEQWVKPSYIPQPVYVPPMREDPQPLYAPSLPEFRPAELPDKQKEMPAGPTMPQRRPDPIPAGNPKEKPPREGGEDKREAPPPKPKEDSPKK